MKYKLSNTTTFRQITGVSEAEIITRFNNALRRLNIELHECDLGYELGVVLSELGWNVEGFCAYMYPESEVTCADLTELTECKIELI